MIPMLLAVVIGRLMIMKPVRKINLEGINDLMWGHSL